MLNGLGKISWVKVKSGGQYYFDTIKELSLLTGVDILYSIGRSNKLIKGLMAIDIPNKIIVQDDIYFIPFTSRRVKAGDKIKQAKKLHIFIMGGDEKFHVSINRENLTGGTVNNRYIKESTPAHLSSIIDEARKKDKFNKEINNYLSISDFLNFNLSEIEQPRIKKEDFEAMGELYETIPEELAYNQEFNDAVRLLIMEDL